MPEHADREAFLALVAAGLDMPSAAARDALDELGAHLDDAADDAAAHGVPRAEAERRAIARLGDPAMLGRELTRAHRARQPLLAVVGGAIRVAGTEALRAYLLLLVVIVVSVGLSLPVLVTVLNILDRSYGSVLAGPVANMGTVLLAWVASASVGWVLPGRVTALSGREHRRVRWVVAVAGFAAYAAILWLVVPFKLDAVLAAGLPLAPLAFLAVALRAPEEPRSRPGVVAACGLGLALVPAAVVLGVLTATPPGDADWTANTSAIGVPPEAVGLGPDDAIVGSWSGTPGTLVFDVSLGGDSARRFAAIRAEAWPVTLAGGTLRFGPGPLATAEAAHPGPSQELVLVTPALRSPVDTVRFVVGVLPDGTRVLLDQDLSRVATPAWDGTLARWWSGD